MDILDVLIGRYEASMNEYFYEINRILLDQRQEKAIDKLDAAVQKYVKLKEQAEMLKDIKGQMKAMAAKQKQDAELDEN
ncbi:MAG: hypothetical protein ACXADH_00865 [Candidatus Kariarchaeaceae archaeon]|jgi:23S rRNA maturation mini-RNase III